MYSGNGANEEAIRHICESRQVGVLRSLIRDRPSAPKPTSDFLFFGIGVT